MITWKHNDKPVMAKMSHNFEGLVLTLHKFDPKTKRLQFVDNTDTIHNTYAKYVEFVDMPVNKVDKISDLMNYTEEDYI